VGHIVNRISSKLRYLTDEPVYYLYGISFPVLDHIPSLGLFKSILLCGPSESGAKSLLTLWRHLGEADVLARLTSIRPILRAALLRPSITGREMGSSLWTVSVAFAPRQPIPDGIPLVPRQILVGKFGLPGRIDQREWARMDGAGTEDDALGFRIRIRSGRTTTFVMHR
jgi:hypothetical protein